MEIYVDVLVIENCIVNFFLLTLTMKCIKHKCKIRSLISSSFIGGLYTLVIIIPKFNMLASFPCEIIVAFIMLKLAYGKSNIFNMLKLLAIFFLMTFTLSGACFLLSIKQNSYVLGNGFKIEKYSIKFIILGIILIYIICDRFLEYMKDRIFTNSFVFEIEFEVRDKTYNFKSFLDTGNELREPVTNLPCILIEENLINDIAFGDDSYHIPYSSIGSNGSLKGIRVNNLKIKNKNLSYEEIDVIICPCKEKLSKECEFNALLSRGIVYKGDRDGKANSTI